MFPVVIGNKKNRNITPFRPYLLTCHHINVRATALWIEQSEKCRSAYKVLRIYGKVVMYMSQLNNRRHLLKSISPPLSVTQLQDQVTGRLDCVDTGFKTAVFVDIGIIAVTTI